MVLKLSVRTVTEIDEGDFSRFVSEVYGRPYCYQQQDECRPKGVFSFRIPEVLLEAEEWEDLPSEIPEDLDTEEMLVSFDAWLARDPKKPIKQNEYDWELKLWWQRHFYPPVELVIADLHKRGYLPDGTYTMVLDW